MKLTLPDCKTVYLRDLRLSDAVQRYADWLNDPDVNQYLETRYSVQTVESCREFVEMINEKDDEFIFAICDINSDRHVGNIKVGPINRFHNYGDVSLFIGEKSFWGKGVASQAIKLISAYSFLKLKIRRLNAGAYGPNGGSTYAFLKVGYAQEGVLREKFILGNGEAVDGIEVGFLNYDCEYTHKLSVEA